MLSHILKSNTFSVVLIASLFSNYLQPPNQTTPLLTMSNMIKLASNDNEVFEVELKVANMSETIKTMLKDLGVDENDADPIPLQNVNGRILNLIIKWATHHKDDPAPAADEDEDERRTREISEWDKKFLQVDQSTLFEIILAANYLDIKGLLDVSTKTVANMIIGKTPEEIRKHFNIENDFTPEEEERIRKENEWCEEK